MMTDTFRALCAALVDEAPYESPTTCLARTALSQPEPAPTDEEIMELMPQQMRDDLANAARALAGFDRATVKAAGAMRIIFNRHAVDHARAALAKWGRPATQPVLVSERLPEPEDCDSEGKCWVECPAFVDDGDHGSIAYNPSWKLCRCTPSVVYDDTRWLPHHALPTPEATNV